jgi:hypothetical protein
VVLLSVLVWAISSTLSHAQQESDFDYKENANGSLTITGYVGSPRSSMTIPATINGKRVETIGEYFLDGCDWLQQVALANGIKNVDRGAFEDCDMLKSISFPSSLRRIGPWAFTGCESLSNITLPPNLDTLGDTAFAFCEKLTSVSITPSNAYFKSINGVLFNKSASKLLLYPGAKAGTCNIPSNVTAIGELAFGGCLNLSAIEVAASNPNYKSIGGVLFNKQGTRLIQYPAGKPESSYAIPNGVKSLDYESFARNMKLSKVVIPDTVTNIGEYAFYACRKLSQISLPIGLKVIPEGMFDECYSLKQINIPGSITSIGDEAFDECYSLETLHLPKSLSSIGQASFGECRNLTSISIDKANPFYAVKDGVLFNKNFTELIQYPAGKPSPSYKVPDGIVRIKGEAFDGTQKLVGAVIPASVSEIGAEAFSECIKLQMMVFLGDAPQMSEWFVFDQVTKSMKVFYPEGAQGFPFPDWYGFDSFATPVTPIVGHAGDSFERNLSIFAGNGANLRPVTQLPNGFTLYASTWQLSGKLTGTPSASFIVFKKQSNSTDIGDISIPVVTDVKIHKPIVILPPNPPKISSHPNSLSVKAGSRARFSVTASGTNLSYQWRKNGRAIKGATGASFNIPRAKATDAGNYTVTVTNTSGSVLSKAAKLTILLK